ncbi:hypothetical protein F0365_08075 [Nonlabens sp. Ci31]|jgi:hypothetical protein|uniref:hypothetical protein n=1 Tax=Nonlabens sp. Ci31 TaxID=2608253 RepID=UPI0014643C2F|nr:hypothetical protein [Nonlabens sp. Ci31]QJP34357.1 hypothetical protein F0365_08075 [Nonlabens sp. Ci31]
MKTIKFTIASCVLGLLLTSCNDGKRQIATENVEDYSTYVDSISNLDPANASTNWEKIEKEHTTYRFTASESLGELKETESLKNDIDESISQFESYKKDIMLERDYQNKLALENNLKASLIGNDHINDDMKFEWINKDNILSVYQNFVDTAQENRDSYSREDWDEIKLLYEAIDTRKNTVENEGLTSSDNNKIAGLKLRFAPMYTFNRMGAKSEENAKAKQ